MSKGKAAAGRHTECVVMWGKPFDLLLHQSYLNTSFAHTLPDTPGACGYTVKRLQPLTCEYCHDMMHAYFEHQCVCLLVVVFLNTMTCGFFIQDIAMVWFSSISMAIGMTKSMVLNMCWHDSEHERC